jgi:hypothetical protein
MIAAFGQRRKEPSVWQRGLQVNYFRGPSDVTVRFVPSSENGQALGGNQYFDAACASGLTSDQTLAFEGEDHLVNRWRGNLKVALQIRLGGRATEHASVGPGNGTIFLTPAARLS